MDKFRKHLQYDVRLMKRDIRHHLRSAEQNEAHRKTLPDVGRHARWLNQEGDLASPEEAKAAEELHKHGWAHLFDANKAFSK